MTVAAIIVAGGLGAVCRYLAGATWRVNVAGAFLAGLVAGLAPDPDVARVVAVGFLGGLSTFSTWMVDARLRGAWREIAPQLVAGLVLVELGVRLGALGTG